jgi:hypothetical protein
MFPQVLFMTLIILLRNSLLMGRNVLGMKVAKYIVSSNSPRLWRSQLF